MENTFSTSPTGVFLFEIFLKSRKTGDETRKERQRRKMFRQRLANSAINVSKLCTGKPSGVMRVAFFIFAASVGFAGNMRRK
jgi:hypothetical protein